jgi:hypothetical protein
VYLRHSTVRKDGKTHTYWRLVRSVRKVRQKTVAQPGELDAQRRASAQALARHITGRADQYELFKDRTLTPAKIEVQLDGVRLDARAQAFDVWFRPVFAFFIIDVNEKRVVHVAATRAPTARWENVNDIGAVAIAYGGVQDVRRRSRPDAFPPLSPQPHRRPCSTASSVLCVRPTSAARASSGYGILPFRCGLHVVVCRRAVDLPVPVQEGSVRARGPRPRRVTSHLALAVGRVLPSTMIRASGPGTASFRGWISGPHSGSPRVATPSA